MKPDSIPIKYNETNTQAPQNLQFHNLISFHILSSVPSLSAMKNWVDSISTSFKVCCKQINNIGRKEHGI